MAGARKPGVRVAVVPAVSAADTSGAAQVPQTQPAPAAAQEAEQTPVEV